ncbi:MAG: hypothetical protein ABW194_07920 [Novosphingobium sp.]
MTEHDLSKAENPDLRASFAALKRAAQLARKTAIQTDTEIVIVRDGKQVRITADELRQGKA